MAEYWDRDLSMEAVADDGHGKLGPQNFERDVAVLPVAASKYGCHGAATNLCVDLILPG